MILLNKGLYVGLTVALCVLMLGVGVWVAPFARHGVSYYDANVYIGQSVGGVYSECLAGNVITDIGEAYLRDWLRCGLDNATARTGAIYVTVSNDASPVASWTELAGEATTVGCGRVLANLTSWYTTDYGFNATAKFDISGDITVQCAGLQWDDTAESNNNLFACAAFTQTTFASGDFLTVTWVVTVDAN